MLQEIEKSKVLILGFGVEGKATLAYLREKFPEKELGIADKNADVGCEMSDVRCFFGEDYLKNLEEYDLIIKSPGIRPDLLELIEFKKQGGNVTSATNLFMSEVKGTVIGVTGSKGKSTVSSLLYAVLKQAGKKVFLIGNIGNPALEALKNDSSETFYVYEMSSYQLEDLEIKPQYVLINNLFPEHLDYHGSLEDYYEAKINIVESLELRVESEKVPFVVDSEVAQTRGERVGGCLPQVIFYNAGSPELVKRIENKNCQKIPFNDGENSKIENGKLFYKGEDIVDVKDIKLLGNHNLENILGVIALSKELSVESKVISDAIQNFKGLEHRLEHVGKVKEVDFYNDSISTTPESTIQAISALGEDIDTLILGGLDRGYDFRELAELISKSQIRNLILFPETGGEIKRAMSHELRAMSFHEVNTMEECVRIAFEKTEKGKICLLSPASPSYNLFKNFVERGTLYKKFIQEYK